MKNCCKKSQSKKWLFDKKKEYWYKRDSPKEISITYPSVEEEIPPEDPLPFEVSDKKWIRIAARRVGGRRGVEGFGNAREIRKLFEVSHTRQAQRIHRLRYQGYRPDIRMFVRDDLFRTKSNS